MSGKDGRAVKVSFGTDFLFRATDARFNDERVRALDLMGRVMFAGSGILLLQTLVQFCDRARQEQIPERQVRPIIEAWRAVLPVQAPDEEDFWTALETWEGRRWFSDTLIWASAKRAGVTHILTVDEPDGLDSCGVISVNPFDRENDQLINRILPEFPRPGVPERRSTPQADFEKMTRLFFKISEDDV